MSNIKMAPYEMDAIEVLSSDALKELKEKIENELKSRENVRRNELIKNVCDAMNTLHKEFPMVELRMGYQCPECTLDDSFDAMEYFCGGKSIGIEDFYIW